MNGVTTFMYNGRFEPKKELELLGRYRITSFCAPPTEYRMLIKEDLRQPQFPALRTCTGAGEPLNPEVIEVWKKELGLTIRDGYGQTETIILVANLPDTETKPGSMGLPFAGQEVCVVNDALNEAAVDEVGQIAVRVKPKRRLRCSSSIGKIPRKPPRRSGATTTLPATMQRVTATVTCGSWGVPTM